MAQYDRHIQDKSTRLIAICSVSTNIKSKEQFARILSQKGDAETIKVPNTNSPFFKLFFNSILFILKFIEF